MKSKILKIWLLVSILMLSFSIKANAGVSSTDPSVQSGGDVTITIKSSELAYAYKITLADAGGLTFVSATSSAGQVNGSTANGATTSGTKTLATYKFKAPTVTATKKYSVKFNVSVSTDGETYTNVTNTSTVTVNAPNNSGGSNTGSGSGSSAGTTGGTSSSNSGSPSGNSGTNTPAKKSNNANLKNLGIKPNDFKGFRDHITEYNVTVPYDVESVNVYAEVQDSKAKITSGTGNKRLKEGSNKLEVVVTAEDGTKKTYTINVVRNSADEEMVPNVIDENTEEKPEELRLTAISLQDDLNLVLSPYFNSDIFDYTVEVESDLEKLELSGIPNVNGAKIEISGNENLVAGENLVILTVKAEGYDDVVYKIIVNKKEAEEVEEEVEAEPLAQVTDEDSSKLDVKTIIVSAVVALAIVAIILIIIIKVKKSKEKQYSSYYDYYNDYPNEAGKIEKVEEDMSIPEGYTAEIQQDDEYQEKPIRRKGKHF